MYIFTIFIEIIIKGKWYFESAIENSGNKRKIPLRNILKVGENTIS